MTETSQGPEIPAIPRIKKSADSDKEYTPGGAIPRRQSEKSSNDTQSEYTPGSAIPRPSKELASPDVTETTANETEQSAQSETLSQKWLAERPYILLDGEAPAVDTSKTNDGKFDIEVCVTEDGNVGIVTGIDKNQDAITVTVDGGRIRAAVADGVSTGMFPSVVARTAAAEAQRIMSAEEPSVQLFEQVYDAVQKLELKPMIENEIEVQLQRVLDAQAEGLSDVEKLNRSRWLRVLSNLRNDGAIGGTTLGVLDFDKNSGRLQYALKSDTSISIFRADGSIDTLRNTSGSSQIHYRLEDAPYQHITQIDGEVQLEQGDFALMYSDGLDTLKDSRFKAIQDFIASRQGSATVAELVHFIQTQLQETGIGDDTSVVVVKR